jgi:hypothetical protein
MPRPADLRHLLLGAVTAEIRALPPGQAAALRVFEAAPDMLGLIGDARYEPTHTRILAALMSRETCPSVADALLSAFLTACGLEAPEPDAIITVQPEYVIEDGRVDLRIRTPSLIVYVELKIDAGEGDLQLVRYRKGLCRETGPPKRKLVYLTLDGARSPKNDVPSDIPLAWVRVLRAWLRVCAESPDTSDTRFLQAYLRSLAGMIWGTGMRSLSHWHVSHQRFALALVRSCAEEDIT